MRVRERVLNAGIVNVQQYPDSVQVDKSRTRNSLCIFVLAYVGPSTS